MKPLNLLGFVLCFTFLPILGFGAANDALVSDGGTGFSVRDSAQIENGARLQVLKDGTPSADGLELGYDSTGGMATIKSYKHTSTAAYKNLRLDAATQQFLISGTEKMKLDGTDMTITTNQSNAGLIINSSIQGNWNNPLIQLQTDGTTAYSVGVGDYTNTFRIGTTSIADADTRILLDGKKLGLLTVNPKEELHIKSDYSVGDTEYIQVVLEGDDKQNDGTTETTPGQRGVGIDFKPHHNSSDGDMDGRTWRIVCETDSSNSIVKAPNTFSIADITPSDSQTRYRLSIDAKGRIGLGRQKKADIQDRLHIHVYGSGSAGSATEVQGINSDNNNCGIRFTNADTAATSTDGLRIGLDDNELGEIRMCENNDLNFLTNNSQRMVIKSDGKIGIGNISSPVDSVQIHNSATGSSNASALRFSNGDTGSGSSNGFQVGIDASENSSLISYQVAKAIIFQTTDPEGTWERMRIDANGQLGIGVTSPSAKLDVSGNIKLSGNVNASGSVTASGAVAATGNVSGVKLGAGTSSPSEKLEVSGGNAKIANSGEYLLIQPNSPSNHVTLSSPDSHLRMDSGGDMEFDVYSTSSVYKFEEGSGNTIMQLAGTNYGQLALGLNATAANDHLTIYDNIGSNAACARFQNADTGTASTDGFQVGINASEEGVIWNLESNGILFGTAATQRMKIDGSGNVVIGDGSVAAGSGGSHVLAFQEGTTPSVVSSVPQLYAVQHANAIVELRGMDGAGNVNTLTPHNFSMLPPPDPSVELPWSYYSENPYIGVEQNVDLAGVVKAVEHLTGRQFVYSREMVPEKLQGWYANQMREKEQVEQARREEAMKEEIECPKEEALEPYPMTTRVSQTVQEVEYELDPASGQVIPKSVEKQVAQEVPTGQTGWRLKAGARLDPKTGKFYRHKTADEVTIEPYQIKDPPAWILERMQKHGRL